MLSSLYVFYVPLSRLFLRLLLLLLLIHHSADPLLRHCSTPGLEYLPIIDSLPHPRLTPRGLLPRPFHLNNSFFDGQLNLRTRDATGSGFLTRDPTRPDPPAFDPVTRPGR